MKGARSGGWGSLRDLSKNILGKVDLSEKKTLYLQIMWGFFSEKPTLS